MITFNVVQFSWIHHGRLGAENLESGGEVLLARLHGEDGELVGRVAQGRLQASDPGRQAADQTALLSGGAGLHVERVGGLVGHWEQKYQSV